MANTVIGASVQVEFQSVGNLKKELRAATQELNAMTAQFGATSEEAAAAARKVAGLKDSIGDAKALADTFNPDRKFVALGGALQGATAGFSALQGAMGLFGGQSKELEQTLLQVQSAMALQQGISGIFESIDSFELLYKKIINSNFALKANSISGNLAARAMKLFGVSVNTTSNAFRVLKGAIVSTGIGALVVILGELVSMLMDVADSSDEAAEAQENLEKAEKKAADQAEINNRILEDRLSISKRVTDIEIKRAKVAGASEEQITKLTRDNILERQKILEDDLSKKKTSDANYFKTLDEFRKVNAELQDFDLEQELKRKEDADKRDQDRISKSNDQAKKNREARLEAENILYEARKSLMTEKDAELLDLEKKRIEEEKKLIAAGVKDRSAFDESYRKQKAEITKKYDDLEREQTIKFQNQINELKQRLNSSAVLSEQEQARQAVIDKYAKEREELLKQYPNNLQLMILLKQNEDLELSNIDKSFEDKRREQRNENNRLRIESEKAFAAELLAVETELQNQKYNVVNGGLDLLQQLAGKNEKIANVFFAIQKAIEIGRIITSTASSIALIKAQTAAIPAILPPGVPNPAYFTAVVLNAKRIASLKLGAAVNIAQIAAASISKFKSGGQTPSGGGQNEPPPPGNLNAPLQPGLSTAVQGQALNAEAINNLGNQAVRAYVMNSDIQNNNQRNAYLQRNARIG
jgi:hypothetical protein